MTLDARQLDRYVELGRPQAYSRRVMPWYARHPWAEYYSLG